MIYNHIRVWRGDYYDGYLWYPADEDGLLLKINVETGEVDYALAMLMPEKGLKHAYHQIVSTGDGVLWAIPGIGNRILRIDLKSGEQELIDFPDSDRQINLASKFTGCIKHEDKIFCFPGNMNYIMEIDTTTREICGYKSVIEDSDNRLGRGMQNYFSWGTFGVGNVVYASGLFCNYFLEMNLDTKEYQLTELKNEIDVCGFQGIAIHENKLYTANKKGHVRVYDLESKAFLKQLDTEKKYRMLCGCEEGILLVPDGTDNYAFYHVGTGEIKEKVYPEAHKFANVSENAVLVKDVIEYGSNYYITCPYSNMTVVVNMESGEISFIPLYLKSGTELTKYLLEQNGAVVRENVQLFCTNCTNLKSFICSVTENGTTEG